MPIITNLDAPLFTAHKYYNEFANFNGDSINSVASFMAFTKATPLTLASLARADLKNAKTAYVNKQMFLISEALSGDNGLFMYRFIKARQWKFAFKLRYWFWLAVFGIFGAAVFTVKFCIVAYESLREK